MRRVVLDTSIVVAALRTRRGAANAVLRLVARRRLVVLATPPLFLEYEEVLKRPEQQLVHGLAVAAIDDFLAELVLTCINQSKYAWGGRDARPPWSTQTVRPFRCALSRTCR